jgi:hypothetical protein
MPRDPRLLHKDEESLLSGVTICVTFYEDNGGRGRVPRLRGSSWARCADWELGTQGQAGSGRGGGRWVETRRGLAERGSCPALWDVVVYAYVCSLIIHLPYLPPHLHSNSLHRWFWRPEGQQPTMSGREEPQAKRPWSQSLRTSQPSGGQEQVRRHCPHLGKRPWWRNHRQWPVACSIGSNQERLPGDDTNSHIN